MEEGKVLDLIQDYGLSYVTDKVRETVEEIREEIKLLSPSEENREDESLRRIDQIEDARAEHVEQGI